MTTTALETLAEEFLTNPQVKAAYNAMANEFAVAKALIEARAKANASRDGRRSPCRQD